MSRAPLSKSAPSVQDIVEMADSISAIALRGFVAELPGASMDLVYSAVPGAPGQGLRRRAGEQVFERGDEAEEIVRFDHCALIGKEVVDALPAPACVSAGLRPEVREQRVLVRTLRAFDDDALDMAS
jgi:hypothetical protein